MTSPLAELCVAMGLFIATHIGLASQPVRRPIVDRIGETAFRIAYSVLSFVLIFWVVAAFNATPWIELWPATTALRHLSLTVMIFAFVFVVAGYATPNPSAVGMNTLKVAAAGPRGIQKITRHPIMWGVALWGIVHLLARGDAAGVVLFGGLTVVALVGAWSLDAKKSALLGDAWDAYRRQTSFVPFLAMATGRTRLAFREIGWWRIGLGLAVYVVFLSLHGWLFGINPWPL